MASIYYPIHNANGHMYKNMIISALVIKIINMDYVIMILIQVIDYKP